MALVMKNDMVENYLGTKMAITNGVTTNVVVDDTTHLDVITYPAQEGFENGAMLALIQKPFIDFAVSCGAAGAMTADMITEKYAEVPADMASAIATDFATAYGNYVIIPEGMTLAITAGVPSIFDLQIPEEPVETV